VNISGNLCAKCNSSLVTIKEAYPRDEHSFCGVCSRPIPDSKNGQCYSCSAGKTKVYGAAPFIHDGTASKLVHALKFGSVECAADILAGHMFPLMPKDADALVPVPLAKVRRRERGYNQSALLCRELSSLSRVPVRDILIKTVNKKPQVGLTNEQRKVNPVGAYAMADETLLLDGYHHIVLVDDVRTTGSTALAAMRVLYEHKAAKVSLLTATITDNR
jgi:ComF family protein